MKNILMIFALTTISNMAFAKYTEVISRCTAITEKPSFITLSLQVDQQNSDRALVVALASDNLIDVHAAKLVNQKMQLIATLEDGRVLTFQRYLDKGIRVQYYNDRFTCDEGN